MSVTNLEASLEAMVAANHPTNTSIADAINEAFALSKSAGDANMGHNNKPHTTLDQFKELAGRPHGRRLHPDLAAFGH